MSFQSVPALYKYMSADRLIATLRSPCIRFTQPDALNDPYECHLTLDRRAVLEDYRRSPKQSSVSARALDDVIEATESQIVIDAFLQYKERRNSLGVLSLSEDPLQLLMWAHYGDEHRGVAIEMDIWHPALLPRSDGGNQYSDLQKVRYERHKVKGLPWPNKIIEVLSTKSPDWSYEREWRLIRTLNLTREAAPSIHVVDFDLSAIKTIYLGARFDARRLQDIVSLLPEKELEKPAMFKLDVSPSEFKLVATPVEEYGWKLLHRKHLFGEAAAEALTCLTMNDD